MIVHEPVGSLHRAQPKIARPALQFPVDLGDLILVGEFRRQLEYKSLWARKHLVVIDQFFPSSKMCNTCGALNGNLTLSDREWDCDCGAHHKRDLLASCNIRDEGLGMLAAGYAESLNARGDTVRLAKVSSC